MRRTLPVGIVQRLSQTPEGGQMCKPQERESALATRCTRYAAEYLCQFRVHPLYPEVLSRLENLPGTIYALDIEHVFLEATKQKVSRR